MRVAVSLAIVASVFVATPCAAQISPVEQRFVSAAKARDFATMRSLLTSPVVLGDGRALTADEFIAEITNCEALNPAGGMMGWACPAEVGGRPTKVVFIGGMKPDGERVTLISFGYMEIVQVSGQ